MVIEIDFCEIENATLLKKEVKTLFSNNDYLHLDKLKVINKDWGYAQMEENEFYILEEDAENFSDALKKMNISNVYSACAEDFFSKDKFATLKISADKVSIEQFNNYFHEIPNMDSFIFSEYPLRFLIMRPAYTIQACLFYIGEAGFIQNACKGNYWSIGFD